MRVYGLPWSPLGGAGSGGSDCGLPGSPVFDFGFSGFGPIFPSGPGPRFAGSAGSGSRADRSGWPLSDRLVLVD